MAALDSGVGCWISAVTPVLAFDAWLVRTGRRSLSEHAGAHRVLTAVLLAYLGLHLLRPRSVSFLHRYDPLSLAARRLGPKGNP